MKEIHPIALCYPKLPLAEYETLRTDIKKNGLIVPIVLYEDKVLDGVHRQTACEQTGTVPNYTSPEIKDPYAYVVSLNERRRNLTTGQRALVAERMATLQRGRRQKIKSTDSVPLKNDDILITEAARLNKVGRTSVTEVRYAKDNGIPEIHQALEAGKLKPYRAGELARLPKPEQPAALKAELNGDKRAGNRKRGNGAKASSQPKQTKETRFQRMERLNEMLRKNKKPGDPLVGLTREQVDPDFKGTGREWVDKYGHVQIMTKAELEADQKNAALLAWVEALNDLRTPLERYLKTLPVAFEDLEAWVKRSQERRARRLEEMVSLFTRARDSIEAVPELLGKLAQP